MIRILTDSACDILPAEAQQLGVTVIPLNVTLEDGTVTVRHRDTMQQERVKIEELHAMVDEECSYRKLFKMLNL